MHTYIYVRLDLDIYTICISYVEWPKRRLSNKKCSCLNVFNAGNISVRWVFSSTPFYRWESWGSESEVSTNRKRKSWDLTPGHILTTCNLSSPDSTCVTAMKGANASQGLSRVPGTQQVFNKCRSQAYVYSSSFSHTRWPAGIQGLRETGGLGFYGPDTCVVGTGLQGQRDTLSPAARVPQILIFGQVLDGLILKSVFGWSWLIHHPWMNFCIFCYIAFMDEKKNPAFC